MRTSPRLAKSWANWGGGGCGYPGRAGPRPRGSPGPGRRPGPGDPRGRGPARPGYPQPPPPQLAQLFASRGDVRIAELLGGLLGDRDQSVGLAARVDHGLVPLGETVVAIL